MNQDGLGHLGPGLAWGNHAGRVGRGLLASPPGVDTSPRSLLKPLLTLQQIAVVPFPESLADFRERAAGATRVGPHLALAPVIVLGDRGPCPGRPRPSPPSSTRSAEIPCGLLISTSSSESRTSPSTSAALSRTCHRASSRSGKSSRQWDPRVSCRAKALVASAVATVSTLVASQQSVRGSVLACPATSARTPRVACRESCDRNTRRPRPSSRRPRGGPRRPPGRTEPRAPPPPGRWADRPRAPARSARRRRGPPAAS